MGGWCGGKPCRRGSAAMSAVRIGRFSRIINPRNPWPRGRSPIVSNVVPARSKPGWVDRAWQRIHEEVAAGRQAYVVCSRIGDGDDADTGKKSGAARKHERLCVKRKACQVDTPRRAEVFPSISAGVSPAAGPSGWPRAQHVIDEPVALMLPNGSISKHTLRHEHVMGRLEDALEV